MNHSEGLFAGFDIGTQGLKALLIDTASGRTVARAGASYGLIQGLPPGAAEQQPETWIEALGQVSRSLFSGAGIEPQRLLGLGVSGQQHGLVVLDQQGRVLRAAKLWCDTTTVAEARELSSRLGRALPTGFTAPKVLWLARHEAQVWRSVRHVLLPHDYVNYRLSGSLWCEPGDASGTGWLDVRTRRIDAQACAAIDPRLEECLPALFESDAIGGRLSAQGARLLGLPESLAGTPISSGGGDNMMSAIGAGATRPQVAVLSLGTSATVFAHSAAAVIDPAGLVAPFCDASGGWLPLLCLMNAAGALEELRACFGVSHAQLEREARELTTDPDGPVCLPYFQGERVPDLPHARAAFLGLSGGSMTRARLYRACLEGIALNLAAGVERLRALGVACTQLRAVGGGARNALWLELIADACNAGVTPLEEAESAALGAALQARWCLDSAGGRGPGLDALSQVWSRPGAACLEPDPTRRAALLQLGQRFQDAQEALYPASSLIKDEAGAGSAGCSAEG
jgi:xylulokinase